APAAPLPAHRRPGVVAAGAGRRVRTRPARGRGAAGDRDPERVMGRLRTSHPAASRRTGVPAFARPSLVALLALVACNAQATEAPAAEGLAETIAARDAAVFQAFNRCADPAQLEAHASHFDPQVEFYHDT